MDTGDTAWLLMSTALVMLMTPGLALFYGGMVRRKNVLSTLMMSFVLLGVIGILWVLYGYTLGFGTDIHGLLGGLNFLGLRDVGTEPSATYATSVPHMGFMVFQGMFAVITVALWTGAVVDRMKFSSFLIIVVLWFTLVYCPVAHWVWGDGGWLFGKALDFAGGAVVHINAGVSALALAMLVGPRKGFREKVHMEPHSVPMVVMGAGLLWFGWFGFNAGSALAANGSAFNAFVTTNVSAAAATVTWVVIGWVRGRPSVLGAATGAVAGLVAITPGAGFVTPLSAIVIGAIASVVCYGCMVARMKTNVDESLDVFSVHGMGGVWGALATGIFASAAVGGAGGALEGNWGQLGWQVVSVLAVAAFAFVMTLAIGKLVKSVMGLRVTDPEESVGLDISQHGERAYGGIRL